MRYDTVIIGAGLSGLAAGIRLAHFNRRVCLLERHTTIGGLNSFYRLRGRTHDVGLHAVTNYNPKGSKSGPLPRILRQLRFSWDDFGFSPQLSSKISFPGVTLRFSNDPGLLESEIALRFPGEIEGFRRLVKFVEDQPWGTAFPSSMTARSTLAEYLSDPLLIEMLLYPVLFYGSASPHDVELTQFLILFRSIYRDGFARPYDGVRRILSVLVKRFRHLGGEVRLRSGVQAIESRSGKAVAVVLDDGTRIEADTILSSAGSVETARLCEAGVTGDVANGDSTAIPSQVPGELTFFESIAMLDRPPAELGIPETTMFYCGTPRFRYQNPDEPCNVDSGVICSPNNFAYEQPLPESTLRLTVMANNRFWFERPSEEDYQEQKRIWRERIFAAALSHIPDFRPHIVDIDTFSPRTIRKYTGHHNGCVYGSPHKQWDGTTHLSNLFLCGTDQGMLGIVGAMFSGISMANKHVLGGQG
ncbi:MAG: NAD(P)/FAD-dependent oxidoreductase [Planctomycetota bacterium]|nr:NAD(P)/FAD-dependent oxidoreductase [Planctomycetota bacterium]